MSICSGFSSDVAALDCSLICGDYSTLLRTPIDPTCTSVRAYIESAHEMASWVTLDRRVTSVVVSRNVFLYLKIYGMEKRYNLSALFTLILVGKILLIWIG